uniref:Reverse transcriptase domain-containing protein n=1 Tax=Moniliophthora roreri TaxID=221103 RepID=A0A0W0FPV0_MONRR
MASPFFFVGKKEKGKLRPTQDYCRLNHGTVKNAYPLPLISDLIDKLKDTTIFSKLDLRNGYNNVWIKDRDQWKAAFKTNQGLFEPTVMFFGLMNSPATFQAFIDDILQDFMAEGWCLVYMDDILIYSELEEQHQDQTKRLLQRLKEQDLYLKPHKCQFDVQEIDFLGLIIQPGQISMDPVKLLRINLPKIADCDSILVVVDHAATKGVIFIPCHKKIDATDTAELLFQHVYKRFGLPDKIISD